MEKGPIPYTPIAYTLPLCLMQIGNACQNTLAKKACSSPATHLLFRFRPKALLPISHSDSQVQTQEETREHSSLMDWETSYHRSSLNSEGKVLIRAERYKNNILTYLENK